MNHSQVMVSMASGRTLRTPLACLLALLTISPTLRASETGADETRADETGDAIDFTRDVRPILSNRCFTCHGPDRENRKGRLRLDTEEGAKKKRGKRATLVPGKPDESHLYLRIVTTDEDDRMPPAEFGDALSTEEADKIRRWIEAGAPWALHWSYVAPVRPPVPESSLSAPADAAIDQFLLARLEREGLRPAESADRHTLVRRVALDLTGLPPTEDEVAAFLADESPEAYENLVDRLLEKPAYGEHWARAWLDLARYADSAGYADDPPRTIWAYRDWVIRAINDNMPFDQFTVEQIAGDLLPEPSESQLVATAFHRNTLTNNEGGTNDEEYRNVAIVDRVTTTMATWMGTTATCAQCHDHKYDPLSQREFFQLFAFFNNTEDADRRDERPLVSIWSEEARAERARLAREIEVLEKRQPEDAEEKKKVSEQIAALKKKHDAQKPVTTVPIQRERVKNRRTTRIQRRGNFLDTADEVEAATPAAFHPLAEGVPADRLALARWLVDAANPLTARVVANRYWEKIFGVGIVRTSEEFGAQGELPVHPELLDWLAVDLVESGWDIKRLLRTLVTSHAYRRSSRVTPELWERDPDNRLLAIGPRVRLTAEMVRDQALAVSGLLSTKLYGPPVRPPQPELGVKAAFGGGIDWKTSTGADRYRRGIYTTWRRSNPYPSMAAFDAPNREVCTLRRTRTNTPLQALVTLNDPVYVEAAQSLARHSVSAGKTPRERAAYAFQRCLIRPPTEAELERLVELYGEARGALAKAPEEARKLATIPIGEPAEGSDLVDLAAWTLVANTLLNLDEMFLKP